MFPSLVKLDVLGVKLASSSWLGLAAHPHMTDLHLSTIVINATDAPLLWRVCGRLRYLGLHEVAFDNGTIPAGAVFDHMRELIIAEGGWDPSDQLNSSEQLDLILRCPNLEKVSWHAPQSDENDEHPNLQTDRIPEEHWHRLEELSLHQHFQDKQLASILEGIGDESLVHLALNGSLLEVQVSKALHSQYATLVTLDLDQCRSVSSTVSRDVLSSCPRLESLITKGVLARDVVAGGPWVCQRLRVLGICFLFGESEQDLQQAIFGRLSALTQLEHWYMHIPTERHNEETGVLEFRLENGLERLATLRRLTTLGFEAWPGLEAYVPQMGKDEVVWMLANWKKLERVIGTFNRDPEEDQSLKDLFKMLGVTLDVETLQ
jgi:hypothetical protein